MSLDVSHKLVQNLASSSELKKQLLKNNWNPSQVRSLNVSGCKLSSLDGIEAFENLESLDASNNNLPTLGRLWLLPRLKMVKLQNNKISDVAIAQNSKGIVSITTKFEDAEDAKHNLELDLLDLSDNQITQVHNFTHHNSLAVKTLILSGNQIDNFSGLSAFKNVQVLDVEDNVQIDVKYLLDCGLSKGCRIFLKGTKLQNYLLLNHLFDDELNYTFHVDADVTDISHPRLICTSQLNIAQIAPKVFLQTGSTSNGFAEFIYQGDQYPSELLTQRDLEKAAQQEEDNLVKRNLLKSSHFNSLSTVAETVYPEQHSLGSTRLFQPGSIDTEYSQTPQSSVHSQDDDI